MAIFVHVQSNWYIKDIQMISKMYNWSLFKQLSFIYMIQLCAVSINRKNDDALYRQ
jgi:hypothetical protein